MLPTITLGDAGVLAPGRWRWLRALLWLAALFVVVALIGFPGWLQLVWKPSPQVAPAVFMGFAVLAYGVYAALVRFAERRDPDEIALRPLLRELATGLAIGLGMFALVFAILRLRGVYTLAPGNWDDWPNDILKTIATGLREELLIRLVLFRLVWRAFGLWPALLASAALFGMAHLFNPNATWVAAGAIAIEAGLMLAAFYMLSGRIWLSVGVHAAWNFAQGSVFGARVSGMPEQGSLFVSGPVAGSPDWLSGGNFGPEASLPALLVGLAIFLWVFRAARSR